MVKQTHEIPATTTKTELREPPYDLASYSQRGGGFVDSLDGGRAWNYSPDHLALVLRAALDNGPVSADNFHSALQLIGGMKRNQEESRNRGKGAPVSIEHPFDGVKGAELIPVLDIAVQGIERGIASSSVYVLKEWVEILRETVSRCVKDTTVGIIGTQRALPAETVNDLSARISFVATRHHRPRGTLNAPADEGLVRSMVGLLDSAWWLQSISAMIRGAEFTPETRPDQSPFAAATIGGRKMPSM